MGNFLKKIGKGLTKIHDITNPAHKYLKRATGGSELDPINSLAGYKKPPATKPYVRPPARGLTPNPGTGGPTIDFGGNTGGRTYVNNPFVSGALRGPTGGMPPPEQAMAPPPPRGVEVGQMSQIPFDPSGGMQMDISQLGPAAPPPQAQAALSKFGGAPPVQGPVKGIRGAMMF